MTKNQKAALLRKSLDEQLKKWPRKEAQCAPPQGWINAVRTSLGMTSKQLGQRIGIAQGSVIGIEKSEVKGTIQIETLQRIGKAMNCKLVYALVPEAPLETIFAERLMEKAGHPISLKPRHLKSGVYQSLLEACEKNMPLNDVWNEAD